MAPVVPFLGFIGTALGAAASVYGTISSNKQAEESAARQAEYQKQLAAQEAATEAEEKRLAQEAQARTKAYGASLLNNNTALDNMLSGGYSSEQLGGSVISSNLGSGVDSIFV